MYKLYGPPDDDPALQDAVIARLTVLGIADALILRYARIPINARPCQEPLLLRFEVVIAGRAYEARQGNQGIKLGF